MGNIRGEQRIEFAIIGDVVNVASRICDACKQFDTNFLISRTLAERVQTDTRIEIVKDFEVRGRSEKLDLMKMYLTNGSFVELFLLKYHVCSGCHAHAPQQLPFPLFLVTCANLAVAWSTSLEARCAAAPQWKFLL